MVCQVLLGTEISQRRVLFHVFNGCVCGVLLHGGFLVPNARNWLFVDSEVERTTFCISLGFSSRYRLNNMTGYLSSFPVVNILGRVALFSLSISLEITRVPK